MSALKYIQIKHILGKYLQEKEHLPPSVTEDINNDNILAAYFKLTQENQAVANLTRKWFFPKFRHLISLYETGRQNKWLEAFQTNDLVEWWRNNTEEVEKQLLIRLSNCVGLPEDVTGIDINKCQKSDQPMVKGTLFHELYYKSICYSCIDAFQWENNNETSLTVIKGGRMLSRSLPCVACTPDALVIRNIDKFWINLENPKTVNEGNIVMTMEFKTKFIQKVTHEEHKMVLKSPEHALQIFTEKLYTMGLLFNDNTIEDYNNLEMTIKCKKRRSKTQPISYAFFSKKYPFMRQDHFEAISVCAMKNQKRKVTSNILPNLVLHKKTNDLSTHNTSSDECNLSDLVYTGMGCLMIFNHQKNEIIEYRMKKAPFILTLNSDYFNQTLEQHLVSRGYSNGSKAIFALGICLENSSNSVQESELSMVYWYDTGIRTESIIRVSRVIDREIYLVSQSVSSMDGLFDTNIVNITEEEERKKYLPKLLHDEKIISQDLFGDISDISTDSENETDVDNNSSTSCILTPKRKKSTIIYECTSKPNINWNRLQHLQQTPKKTVVSTKRSQDSNSTGSPLKLAALHSTSHNSNSFKDKQLADDSREPSAIENNIETPNLEYDQDLIFGLL